MFIISEYTLEHLVCCQCKKYLSVKPVKVYPNRGIKCGRCSDDNDAGVVSYFGILADQFLFPCINRFDGCGQLLKYSEVAHHEENCMSKEYECPICVSVFKSSSYHIYHHYKEVHTEALLLNNPEFTIDIDQELYNRYLYCKNNLLFFIAVQYIHAEQLFKFTTLFLGDNCDKITQSFKLYSLDRKMKHTSRNKPCYSATSGGDFEWFQVNLEEKNFDKRIVICRFNLDTEQVEGLQRLPESVKAVNSIFKFQPMENQTFNTVDAIKIKLPNQTILPKKTLHQTWIKQLRVGMSKRLPMQTDTALEPLKGSSGTNAGFGSTPTVTTTNTSFFSNGNKSWNYTSGFVQLGSTSSTTTVPSLVTCGPSQLVHASYGGSGFNSASIAPTVMPCTTTQTSSNGGLFGGTITAVSSNRSLFTPHF